MKKIQAILLSLIMAASISVSAMAAEHAADDYPDFIIVTRNGVEEKAYRTNDELHNQISTEQIQPFLNVDDTFTFTNKDFTTIASDVNWISSRLTVKYEKFISGKSEYIYLTVYNFDVSYVIEDMEPGDVVNYSLDSAVFSGPIQVKGSIYNNGTTVARFTAKDQFSK